MASLVPWHPEQLPLLEGLPRTPDHCPSPLFPFFGYYSRCRLTDAQWRTISMDMLASPLPTQPKVLRPPLLQVPLLAHIKLDERLGSLHLCCRVFSKQSTRTLGCSMPLSHSSCKVLHLSLLIFLKFSPSHFLRQWSATSQPCPPVDQLLPKKEMELRSLQD